MNRHLSFTLASNGENPAQKVAQGVVFSSGKVALETDIDAAISIYDDIASAIKTHCKGGRARILWGYCEVNFKQFCPISIDGSVFPIPEELSPA